MGRLIYAGIDEAGYGPMFGPLVISRCVVELTDTPFDPADGNSPAPPLWSLLKTAVCRKTGDKKHRIAVNDSKQLYSPSTGIAHLERGVLAFLSLTGFHADTLESLLKHIGHDATSVTPDLLWYSMTEGGLALPTQWTADQLAIARSSLRRAADSAKFKVHDFAAAVVYEDRFNELCTAMQSKARCAWKFVSHHLDHVWRNFGEHHPWVIVDRQGGRKCYSDLLATLFTGAKIVLLDESDNISRYRVVGPGRTMTVSFEIESEKEHMPVALASMTAKYMRELLMSRFNAFWLSHNPALRPTAGYYTDGQRFLADIEPLIETLQIDRGNLIRNC